MSKQVSLQNTRSGAFGLPTGQIIPGKGTIQVEPEIWNAVKEHPVVVALVDAGTLVVDGKGQEKPKADADGGRDENGNTAEMAEMRKRFDVAFSEIREELHLERARVVELGQRAAELETQVANASGNSAGPLVAEHRGGGSWSVVQGAKTEVLEKLTKEEAEAFNALDADARVKFVADRKVAA